MSNVNFTSILVALVLMFSGCEDRGYGTQDITKVPSVTGSDIMQLISSIPANGGAAAQRAYINLAFSSYLDENSVTNSSVQLLHGTTPIATSFIVARNFIFIKPLESLLDGESYSIKVSGLKDIFDNPLGSDYTRTFVCKSDFWKSVTTGVSYSMAESKAGHLYIWGSEAPLPVDTEEESEIFITIDMPLPLPNNKNAKGYSAGPNNMAFITNEGNLIELGLNKFSDFEDNTYEHISVGEEHSVVLKQDHTIFSWGSNSQGQLGASLSLTDKLEPTQELRKFEDWKTIDAGWNFTLALRENGSFWGWGDNKEDQLGTGIDTMFLPTEVNGSEGHIWTQISGGGMHSVAIDENNATWSWGRNDQGQLGSGDNTGSSTGVQEVTKGKWRYVSAGYDHTLGIDLNKALYAWGNNGSGQLGNNSTNSTETAPVEINATMTWNAVSAGKNYTLGVTTDGRMWAWGSNAYSRLGLDASVLDDDMSTLTPLEVK